MGLLSHVNYSGGFVVDPSKINVVLQWETLKLVMEIRSFLRLAGYYKKFIEGLSNLAFPLMQLTQKGEAYVWDVH